MRRTAVILGLLLPGLALAQQSASFKIEEPVFNAGGHPVNGSVLVSASYRLSLGAIGESVATGGPASASFGLDGGFVAAYPPPGEVTNVRFLDPTTIAWDGERSVGVYNLYQGAVSVPFDPGYGTCLTPGISTESAAVSASPAPGQVLFILLTAENRLGEEGTKGITSASVARDNSNPCP